MLHQGLHVFDDAVSERIQVITTFKHRHHAPVADLIGKIEQLIGDPAVIRGLKHQLRQRVIFVRIKTGGNDQHFRLEGTDRLQHDLDVGFPEATGTGARCQRHVADVGVFALFRR